MKERYKANLFDDPDAAQHWQMHTPKTEVILFYCDLNRNYMSGEVQPRIVEGPDGKSHEYNVIIKLHSPENRMPRKLAVVIVHTLVGVGNYLFEKKMPCYFSSRNQSYFYDGNLSAIK